MYGRRQWIASGVAACAALIAIVVLVAVWPQRWLAVRDDAGLRYVFAVHEGTHFSLAWRHSVEREDWIETFAIRDGAIVLIATRFKTFGAGMPDHAGRRTTLEHGWVVMDGIERVVDPLAVQAAAAEGYRMRRGARWFALSSAGTAPILRFAVVQAPLIAVIGGVLRAWRAPAAGQP